jgi:uncharacterized membrane protein
MNGFVPSVFAPAGTYAMRKVEHSRTERIAWVVSGLFLVLLGLAVLAAVPGFEPLRGLFSSACHQEPDRCYSLFGHPIGLCVRCFWIYLGLAAGHPMFAKLNVTEKNALRMVAVAAALMALDVGLETIGLYHNWKALRAATGGLFGFVVSWFTLRGLSELFKGGIAVKERACHESN